VTRDEPAGFSRCVQRDSRRRVQRARAAHGHGTRS